MNPNDGVVDLWDPIGGADRSAADEARDILDDVPQWRLSHDAWQRIAVQLDAIADALTRGDERDLIAAISDLELSSPRRTTPLGSIPVRAAPRPVRLQANRLVHWITDGVPAAETRAAKPPVRINGPDLEIVVQELIVHVFAPLDGPRAAAAHDRLAALWIDCRRTLSTTEPIPALDLPIDLPAAPGDRAPEGALAAQQSADGTAQVIARRDHDVLNLSIAFRATDRTWTQWDNSWRDLAGDLDAMLGVVQIFVGIAATDMPLPDDMPGAGDDDWRRDGVTWAGHSAWELPPYDDERMHRRLILVTTPDREADLSALVWSRGDAAMTPFTRYLLHSAKIRYELRVKNRSVPGRPGDVEILSRWRDMRLTVDIARSNMATLLDQAGLAGDRTAAGEPVSGPLNDDRELADWLWQAAGNEVDYLEHDLERHASATRIGDAAIPTVGLITALPEEFVAMRELIDGTVSHWVGGDSADYVLGTLPSADPDRPHRVVLTMLADTGTNSAAVSATNLVRSFASVGEVVMVGIAAGVPAPASPRDHVRLGDIVVASWGIVAYDHVVETVKGRDRRQEFPPPSALLAARVKRLTAEELLGERPWEEHIAALAAAYPVFDRPSADTDVLYADERDGAGVIAHPDPAVSGHRPGQPKVHHGRIGSADRSIRYAVVRDDLARQHGLRAMEMEGRGVGEASFNAGRQWFMVRGVSDYADRRHTHLWRHYAAAVAAGYVRAMFAWCPPIDPHAGSTGDPAR